jgi:hypothetical protein
MMKSPFDLQVAQSVRHFSFQEKADDRKAEKDAAGNR